MRRKIATMSEPKVEILKTAGTHKRQQKGKKVSSEDDSKGVEKVKEEPLEGKPVGRRPRKRASSSLPALKDEPLDGYGDVIDLKQRKLTDMLQAKKKRDRFNGMTEDEVLCRTLPDHLAPDLDILIIGINPGLTAAYVGHHYAGPGNHFWKCLFLSGLISEQMNAYDDFRLKEFGIGFTNIVERTSRGSADLTKKEIKEGAEILGEKIRKYKPKIAAFNGKGIYEVFCGHKNFFVGKQPEPFPGTDTVMFVMPSSSARFTQLPRAVDKVPFYVALKKLRDHLRGTLLHLDDSEVTFPDLELKVEPKKERLDTKVKIEADSTKNDTVAVTVAKHRIKKERIDSEMPRGADSTKDRRMAVTTTKRRKRKAGSAADLAQDRNLNSELSDFGSLCPAVKVEPGVSHNSNGILSNLTYSNFAGNLNTCPVPSFVVKEEIPLDLSQYGMMPPSSTFNNPCSVAGGKEPLNYSAIGTSPGNGLLQSTSSMVSASSLASASSMVSASSLASASSLTWPFNSNPLAYLLTSATCPGMKALEQGRKTRSQDKDKVSQVSDSYASL